MSPDQSRRPSGSRSKSEQQCPFHSDSFGTLVDGEIHNIHCKHCGDYRISGTALEMLESSVTFKTDAAATPQGWRALLRNKPVISTRDMRLLVS